MERTLVLCKPDCVQRRLVGRVIARFEQKGLTLVGLKLIRLDRTMAETLYAEHQGKPFYEPLVTFITSGPLVASVWEGPAAIAVVRNLLGATASAQAQPGTIRGDFGLSNRYNLVHGSDSAASAQREIHLFFGPDELHETTMPDRVWLAT